MSARDDYPYSYDLAVKHDTWHAMVDEIDRLRAEVEQSKRRHHDALPDGPRPLEVRRNEAGGWSVFIDGGSQPLSNHRTEAEAVLLLERWTAIDEARQRRDARKT